MNNLKWTAYQNVSMIKSQIGKIGPGVYRIRLTDGESPIPIGRLLDVDNEGLLSIGESSEIKRRIAQFNKSCNATGNHHAGTILFIIFWLAIKTGRSDVFKPNAIQFSYAPLIDKTLAVVTEADLHSKYFLQFGELPPLNGKMTLEFLNGIRNKLANQSSLVLLVR